MNCLIIFTIRAHLPEDKLDIKIIFMVFLQTSISMNYVAQGICCSINPEDITINTQNTNLVT